MRKTLLIIILTFAFVPCLFSAPVTYFDAVSGFTIRMPNDYYQLQHTKNVVFAKTGVNYQDGNVIDFILIDKIYSKDSLKKLMKDMKENGEKSEKNYTITSPVMLTIRSKPAARYSISYTSDKKNIFITSEEALLQLDENTTLIIELQNNYNTPKVYGEVLDNMLASFFKVFYNTHAFNGHRAADTHGFFYIDHFKNIFLCSFRILGNYSFKIILFKFLCDFIENY